MSSRRCSYVDFHCHLDLFPDARGAVARSIDSQVHTLVVTTTPSAWLGTKRLIGNAPRIRVALGLHPQIAHERAGELPQFEALLPAATYVGEIGLDGSAAHREHREIQQHVFASVLEMTSKVGGRIMSIHSRRAGAEVIQTLASHPNAGIPVLHWFSGSRVELAAADRAGCWFSVGPGMLSSAAGIERIKAMPRDRIVTETDGPFVTDGSGPIGPWNVPTFVSNLAVILGEAPDEVADRMGANFRSLTILSGNVGRSSVVKALASNSIVRAGESLPA